MEKTERKVRREGETARLRSGRVALGEITNFVGRDRRKACVVKRVTNQSRACRRPGEISRPVIGTRNKREPINKNLENNGQADGAAEQITRMEVDHVRESAKENVEHFGRCQRVANFIEHSNKVEVTSGGDKSSPDPNATDEDSERTTSCSGCLKRAIPYDIRKKIINTHDLTQYDQEIYEYLLNLEKQLALRQDHLKDRLITGKMRQVVVEWLFEVQNHFNLCQESVQLTVAILDRCLATDPAIDQDNVQLVCLAAIFIATKYHEIFLLELSDLRYICDYSFKECEILNMERRVLKLLNFKLNYALCTDFTGIFMRPMRKSIVVERLVRYLVDLSLLEYRLASVEPSKLAYACLYIALTVLASTSHRCPVNATNYSLLDVGQVILIIVTRAIDVIEADRGGLYNKHLTDTRPGCIRDIVKSKLYAQVLKKISTDLQ